MTDRIGIKLTDLLETVLPFNLSEAEADSYPYAVYYYTPTTNYTKDGAYKIQAEVTIQIYSKSFDEGYDLAGDVKEALEEGMTGEFAASLRTEASNCSEGVWEIDLDYIINQYKTE